MSKIDSEELVRDLEEIVGHFKDDIAPYALQLTEQLLNSYQRLITVNVEEDDGESALAAVGCVKAVRREYLIHAKKTKNCFTNFRWT
jgi:hypothetical protein